MADGVPPAPDRGPAVAAAARQLAEGRRERSGRVEREQGGHAAGGSDFAPAGERLPALCPRRVGQAVPAGAGGRRNDRHPLCRRPGVWLRAPERRHRVPAGIGSAPLASTLSRRVWSAVGYAPYGEAFSLTGGDRNFTGMDQDIVGGVYDFPMREYSPAQGRWWTPDPAGLAGVDPNNPQSWNRYAYVNGSPLNSTDPLGLEQVEVGRCSWDETSFYVDGEYQGTVWTFEGCKEPIPTDLGGDSGGGGGGGGQGPAGSSTGGAQASAGSFAYGLSVPWGTFQTDSRAVPLFQQSLADALTYAFAAANARGIVPQIDSGFLTPEDQQRMLSGGSGPNP